MMNLPLNVDFTGKLVVVTGAGGVLCGDMARAYAQAGAKVAALDLNEEAVKKLAPIAEEYGVQIGLENVWNKFLLSPLEMRSFIDAVGSRWVGAYFDTGNVVYSGYPEQWIKILNKRIFKVHFKDYRRNPGGLNAFVDLLAGDVDWKAVRAAFEAIGYEGWAAGEMIPQYAQGSDQLIYNTSASMERIMRGEL